MALTDTNNIQDPSTIGVGGLSGTRADETGSEIVKGKYSDFASNLTSLAADSRFRVTNNQQYNPIMQSTHTIDRDEVGGQLADFGNSKYDDPFTFQYSDEGIQDNRYEKQWGITKLGLGVAKGAITAGTTFIDGTVGFLNGLGQGVVNVFDDKDETGFLDGLWNNDTHRAMKDVSDKMENTFKIYQSTKNQEGPWYAGGNLISGAFIGDTIIKNIGFMVGAFYSGSFLTKLALIPKALQAMKASNNVVRSAQMFTGSLTSAVGEASIEAINNVSQWTGSEKERLKVEHQRNLAELERTKNILTSEEYQARLDNLNAAYQEGLQKIERDAIHMGNMDFALQIPILTAENAFGWGKLYASNFASSKFMNSIRKTAEGYRGNNLKGAIEGLTNSIERPGVEGVKRTVARMAGEGPFEEMGQSFVNELSGEVAENDVMAYYKARVNDTAYDDVFSSWKSQIASLVQQAPEAFGETYLNVDSWEEGFVGAISSVFGMPKFRSARTAEGKFQSPITFEGGFFQDIRDARTEAAENDKIIDKLKRRLDDPKFLESFEHATAHQAWDYVMQTASREGNQKKFKDAEVNQLISDLYALKKAGLMDIAKNLIETGSDVNINTEEGRRDLDYIKANDKSEIDVPNDPNNPDAGTHKETVSARGWFDKDGNQIKKNEDIVKDIKKRKDEIVKYIEQFDKTTNDLDNDTGGIFSDDQLKELAWLQMRAFNGYDRMGNILHDIQRKNTYNLQDVLDNQKKAGKLSDERYEYLTNALNSTLDSLDFENLTAEKASKLKKKNPELVDILNYFGSLDESVFKSKDLYQQMQDIFEIQNDIEQFNKTFKEYRNNPGLLRAQIDQVRTEARKKKVDEYAKQKEDELSKANDLNEFEEKYAAAELQFELFNKEEGDKYREWFNDYLSKSTDKNVSEYFKRMRNKERYVKSYSDVTSKIDNADFSDFSDERKSLVGSLTSDAIVLIKPQLDSIFEPLLEGLSFTEVKKQISDRLTDIVNDPNTVLSKETKAIADHILEKLEEDEKLNQAKQEEEEKSQTEPDTKNSNEANLLDDDEFGDSSENGGEVESSDINGETTNTQNNKGDSSAFLSDEENKPEENRVVLEALALKKDRIDKTISKIRELIANNDAQSASEVLEKQLIPEVEDYAKNVKDNNIDSKKQTVSDLHNEVNVLRNNIDRLLNIASENAKSQQEGSETRENSNGADILDLINQLDVTELQNILNGKFGNKLGEQALIMLNALDEADRKQIEFIIKAKIDEANSSLKVVVQDGGEESDESDFKNNNIDAESVQSETETPDEYDNRIERPVIKNWVYTLWNFGELILRKLKTRFDSNGLTKTVSFLQRYNSFDFVDKGILGIMYNNNPDLPIYFISTAALDDISAKAMFKHDRRVPILAIKLEGKTAQSFNVLTTKYLGFVPETIDINGEKYYPVGVPAFYNKKDNDTAKTESHKKWMVLEDLLFREGLTIGNSKEDISGPDKVSKYTTKIFHIFSGRLFTMSDDIPVPSMKPLSQTKLNDLSKLIFGVKNRTGEIITPQASSMDVVGLKHSPNVRLGSTWILIRGGDGKLYPTATRVARFNKATYDWRKNMDKPIVQKMLEVSKILCDSSKPDGERSKAKFLFERLLGFPTDNMGNVINPIVFKSGTDIVSIKPMTGQKISQPKGNNTEELAEAFLDAMMEANYKFNVSLTELKSGELFDSREEYLNFIVKSDIVFTNLVEPSFAAASFEIQPLDKNGNIDKQEHISNSDYNGGNISKTSNINIEYQMAGENRSSFDYDDAGNVLNEGLTSESKQIAEDLFRIERKYDSYFDETENNGKCYGGIYHKDDTSYYIERSGASAYVVYTKNSSDYDKIVKAFNDAEQRMNQTPEQQKATAELESFVGQRNQQSTQTFTPTSEESREGIIDLNSDENVDQIVSGEQSKAFNGETAFNQKPRVWNGVDETAAITIGARNEFEGSYPDNVKRVAKILGKTELTDEEATAVYAMEYCRYSLDTVNSVDELNMIMEKLEECNEYPKGFRFKKPSKPTTKRKPGQDARDFGDDLLD